MDDEVYKCYICKGTFDDESIVTTLVDGRTRFVCLDCYYRRLKEMEENGTACRCVSCDEVVHENDATFTPEGPLCWPCYEYDCEHASTLLRYSANLGKAVVHIGDYICEDVENGEDADYWVDDILNKREWHKTDPWRGYFESKLKEGYVELADGWSTGRYSDVLWKHTINDLGDWLADHGDECPGQEGLYVLLEPTSNIFSMATTFFCKEEDVEVVTAWLAENGFEVEALNRALR